MPVKAKTTQEFIPIKEVRDGIIILKNDDLRAIVLANSINLALKSADEQQATIFQFQNFLNTLDFPIQISIQSRRLDIRSYLLTLENRMKVQTEPLLKLQTKEYIDFIKDFTDTHSIMKKNFFIVVPYTHVPLRSDRGIIDKLFSRKNKEQIKAANLIAFEEKRSQLEERVAVIQQGLASCGIKSAQLGSEEVIEVFYKVFNPGEIEGKIKLENKMMDFFKKLLGVEKKPALGKETGASILAVLPEEIYESANLELQDIIAPSALKIEAKSIDLGDKIARTFFIISYPRFLTDNWFSPIINLDKIFDVSIFVHPIDTSIVLKTISKKSS